MWNFDVYADVVVAGFHFSPSKIISKIKLRCKRQKAPFFKLHFQFLVVLTVLDFFPIFDIGLESGSF